MSPPAIVVCGGRGTRLGPLGDVVHKCLLPVDGAPILAQVIASLQELFGCDRCILVTGHLGWQIRHVLPAHVDGVELVFVDDRAACGTARAVLDAVSATGVTEFIYAHGNVLIGAEARRDFLRWDGERADESVVFASRERFAPTHPRIAVSADGRLASAGSTDHYAVGLARLERAPWPDAGLDGVMLEEWLMRDERLAARTGVFDAGGDWRHLETLSFFGTTREEERLNA